MAKRSGDGELAIDRERLRDRVAAAFDGFEPQTAVEVARDLGVSTTTAREHLESLVEAGTLESKTVDDDIRVWYRRSGGSTDAGGDPAPAAVDERIDAALADLSMPGASEMMRSWRRDAVRAAVEHVRMEGPVTPEELFAAVYPAHGAGYDDREEWWAAVGDRLWELPGVRRSEEGVYFDAGRL